MHLPKGPMHLILCGFLIQNILNIILLLVDALGFSLGCPVTPVGIPGRYRDVKTRFRASGLRTPSSRVLYFRPRPVPATGSVAVSVLAWGSTHDLPTPQLQQKDQGSLYMQLKRVNYQEERP